jgi:hypothetical protein
MWLSPSGVLDTNGSKQKQRRQQQQQQQTTTTTTTTTTATNQTAAAASAAAADVNRTASNPCKTLVIDAITVNIYCAFFCVAIVTVC